MNIKFRSMKNNKWKIMNNKKKESCRNLYRRFNLAMHHHSWFVDLLGLISLHKGILLQTIFC